MEVDLIAIGMVNEENVVGMSAEEAKDSYYVDKIMLNNYYTALAAEDTGQVSHDEEYMNEYEV